MSSYNVHSPWRKSAIMPIWSFQLTLLSVDLVISALILVIINNIPAQEITVGGRKIVLESGSQNWNIANLALAAMSLLFTCIEIVLYICRDLSPAIYIGSALMKAVMWTIVLILDIVAINSDWAKGQWNNYIIYVVVGFASAVYLVLVVGVVYGVVVFLRQRGTISDNVERWVKNSDSGY